MAVVTWQPGQTTQPKQASSSSKVVNWQPPQTVQNPITNTPTKTLAPVKTIQAPAKGFKIGDVISAVQNNPIVKQTESAITKLSNGIKVSLTTPTLKKPIQEKDVVKPQAQKQQIPTLTNFDPKQKQLTPLQLQQINPSSATMKVTPKSLDEQKKFVEAQKIPQQKITQASQAIKKFAISALDSLADSNPDNPFVTLTDVKKEDWKKMDTKQKLAAVGDSTLMALAPVGGGGASKGFSKIAASIGFSTNAVLHYLRDSNHSLKDAILQPDNIVFGLIGGKLGAKEGELAPGEHTPQEVIDHVVQNDLAKTKDGETLMKTALEAQKTGQNIAVEKSNPVIDAFEQNKKDYQSFGGKSVGTESPNAALRDIQTASENPEVQAHTKSQVQKAIDTGELPINEDNTITLYRGGNPSDVNGLTSATYDKTIAQKFADSGDGVLHEIKVKPDDIQAFIGKAEKEVLVKNETVKPNVAQQSISDTEKIRQETNKNLREMGVPENEIPKGEEKSKITRVSTIGTPKLASGVRIKAIKEKLIYGFDKTFMDLPEYDKVNVKEQGQKATEFLFNQPDDAFEIAMGRKQPPNGILPESIFNVVEKYAIETKNVDLLRELATKSQLTSEATGMGQRIRMLAERNPESPVTAMRKVTDARKSALEQKGKTIKSEGERIVKEIKQKVKKPDKNDWSSFIDSIKC